MSVESSFPTSMNQFVPDVRFEKIPIRNLVSNQEYQRNLSQKHIRRTVANFDLLQVNPVKVSRRNGINYVFNGQHTIEIVAAVSGSRDTPVWCMVYDNMDYTLEADTFANQQKYVKPLLPHEIFVANLEAGNDKQLMIKALVESLDLTIGPTKALGTICAVSSLEEIYDKHGYHVLERTLMDMPANEIWSMPFQAVCKLPRIRGAIDIYGEVVKCNLRGATHYDFYEYNGTMDELEESMRTNMGGGLPAAWFYEMKQDIYDLVRFNCC